jgi:hypothetical protein
MLNVMQDNPYFYVHITDQFNTSKDIDHDSIERAYYSFLNLEQEYLSKIAECCSLNKGAFIDEALNIKNFNFTYGCGFGSYNWPLYMLKVKPKNIIEDMIR